MVCVKPIILNGVELPCGKCLACKIAKSIEWRNRIMHELDYYKDACFLTLTYEDGNLSYVPDLHRLTTSAWKPVVPTLVKSDVQKFFKKLRKNNGTGFKYFCVGDYGDLRDRPHYHIILLGISPNWVGFKFIKTVFSKGKIIPLHEVKEWTHGFVHVGTVTKHSVRYVTDYLTKVLYGIRAKETYGLRDVPFKIVSQGLGLRYVNEHRAELLKNEHFRLDGVPHGLPRYYREKLGLINIVYTDRLQERASLVALAGCVGLMEKTGHIKSMAKENQFLLKKIRKQQQINLEKKMRIKGRIE